MITTALTIKKYELIKNKNQKDYYKIKLFMTYTAAYPNVQSLIYYGAGIEDNNLIMSDEAEEMFKIKLNNLLGYGPFDKSKIEKRFKDFPIIYKNIKTYFIVGAIK